jgi:predicted CXXCH cytochrome family protein
MRTRNGCAQIGKFAGWIRSYRTTLLIVAAVLAAVLAISCGTVTRTVVAPPQIAGAQFVGSETCAQCHQDIARGFQSADHSRMKAPGENAKNVGCESCHGPASIHNESGGAHGTIINPRKSPETCFQCHLDKRAEFSLPYAHPVFDGPHSRPVSAGGKVSCGDCHNPHKGPAVIGSGTALSTEQETCGKCHIAQRGPFVFEHEAVREGCTTCHKPHGSVNPRMLAERNHVLCLKCHLQEQTVGGRIYIGGQEHSGRLGRGTCWSAGCHEAVHGSQVGSSLRF